MDVVCSVSVSGWDSEPDRGLRFGDDGGELNVSPVDELYLEEELALDLLPRFVGAVSESFVFLVILKSIASLSFDESDIERRTLGDTGV